jgi:hypothetical protein
VKNCLKRPTCAILAEKIVSYCKANGLNPGFDIARKKWGDKDWMCLFIASLNPDDEIFDKNYAPPKTNAIAPEHMIDIPAEAKDSLQMSLANASKNRKGMMALLMSPE